MRPAPRLRHLTLFAVIGVGMGLWGLWIGLQPLSDNSFLTHLATGRLIVDEGIPRADPFTYTAAGVDWVVQSWLVASAYGLLDRWWGGDGLLFFTAALTTLLGVLVFRLTRPAEGVIVRLGLSALGVAIGTAAWSERPLLVGLLAFGAVILVGERGLDPRWLVPVMWIWVNSHGSFPLGLVYLAALTAGARMDGERPASELRALAWAAGGTVLGVVSPLGLAVLTFPVELLSKQDVLRNISEWQAPRFTETAQRLFLLQIALTFLALVRRPTFRAALPAVLFTAAGLLAARNMGVASLVLLPVAARALHGLGTIEGGRRAPVFSAAVAALASLAALLVADVAEDRAFAVAAYPTAALAWTADEGYFGEGRRVATQDFVGNYLEVLEGAAGIVFIDDRYDMFPEALTDDYLALARARPRWQEVFDRYDVEAVVWEQASPLGTVLRESDRWRIAFADARWMVAVRRDG